MKMEKVDKRNELGRILNPFVNDPSTPRHAQKVHTTKLTSDAMLGPITL